jgi:cell division protein FtsX
MDIQSRKLQFIQGILTINDEKIIEKLESVLKDEQQKTDPGLKEKLTSRALKANEDIKSGKVYNREEAEKELRNRMGI